MNIEKKVDKAALLILLKEGDRDRQTLVEVFPDLDSLLEELRVENGLNIVEKESHIGLETNIIIDLFQDIPPEARDETRSKVEQVEPDFYEYEETEETRPIVDLIESDIDSDNIKDFRPEPPYPVVWEERLGVPSAKDSHSILVCPEDSIHQMENGKIILEDERCPGCIIPAIKDPFNTITVKDNLEFEIKRYTEDDDVVWITATAEKCREITEKNLEHYQQPRRQFSKEKINDILDNFERRTGRSGRRWEQTPYYVFVRNCLRLLGMDAKYTGGPGMKTRSDVTVYAPIYVTIEVKSPAEGMPEKAVRQAVQSSLPLEDQHDEEVYQTAIGAEISADAKDLAEMWERNRNIKTPLITGRILLFLVLMQAYTALETQDFRFLFGELSGEVTSDDIVRVYNHHFDRLGTEEERRTVIDFINYCL